MNVVSRKELMKLIRTKEVLFSNVYNSGLEGLYVASHFSIHDFVETDLIGIVEDLDEQWLTYEHLNTVDNFSLDLECGCREGLYDEQAKYAIYEKEDINKLISRLSELNK